MTKVRCKESTWLLLLYISFCFLIIITIVISIITIITRSGYCYYSFIYLFFIKPGLRTRENPTIFPRQTCQTQCGSTVGCTTGGTTGYRVWIIGVVSVTVNTRAPCQKFYSNISVETCSLILCEWNMLGVHIKKNVSSKCHGIAWYLVGLTCCCWNDMFWILLSYLSHVFTGCVCSSWNFVGTEVYTCPED